MIIMKYSSRHKSALFIICFVCLVIMSLIVPTLKVFALTKVNYPLATSESDVIAGCFKMNMSTFTYQINDSTVGVVNDGGNYIFYCKNVNKDKDGYPDITIKSTGHTYGGKPSTWKLRIRGTVSGAGTTKRNQPFCRVRSSGLVGVGGHGGWDKGETHTVGSVTLKRSPINEIDVQVTSEFYATELEGKGIVYSDPFVYIGLDFDTNKGGDKNCSVDETCELGWGFTGRVYCTSQCQLRMSGNVIKSPANCPGTEDLDTFNKTGFIADSSVGAFTVNLLVHGSASNSILIKPMSNSNTSPPVKSVNKSQVNYGEDVVWSISKRKGTWLKDQVVAFSSMSFKDTLPADMEYKSCQLYDNGTAVNYGSASYNAGNRLLTYTISSSYLANTGWYNGTNLELKIITTCKVSSHKTETRKNTATVQTNEGSVETGTVTVTIPPALRKITTEVVNGTIHPGYPDAYIGNNYTIDYQPKTDYYLKYIEVDGSKLGNSDLESNMDEYTFENVQADHHIKVVYAKNPIITLVKNINKGNVVWAKGSPIFSYKISGKDYLGHDMVFYRNISFGSGDGNSKSLQIKIPAGQWVFSELKTNDWKFVSVTANPVGKTSIDAQKANIDTRDIDAAGVTYTNDISSYKDYTDNRRIVNQLK